MMRSCTHVVGDNSSLSDFCTAQQEHDERCGRSEEEALNANHCGELLVEDEDGMDMVSGKTKTTSSRNYCSLLLRGVTPWLFLAQCEWSEGVSRSSSKAARGVQAERGKRRKRRGARIRRDMAASGAGKKLKVHGPL